MKENKNHSRQKKQQKNVETKNKKKQKTINSCPKNLKLTSLGPAKSYMHTTSRDINILQHSTINYVPCTSFKTGKYIFR